MDLSRDLIIFLSRIGIASIYLWAARTKLFNWKGTIAYMESKGFPLIPLMLPAAILLQIGGSFRSFWLLLSVGGLSFDCFHNPSHV